MARVPGAENIYEVAELFRQRCLKQNKSILWSEDDVWTIENINEIERQAFGTASSHRDDDLKYWDDISRTLSLPLRKLGAEIAVMYQLFPVKSAESKVADVEWMFEGDPPLAPDEEAWSLVERAFTRGLGSPGRWYSSGGQESSSWFYAAFARQVKNSGIDVYDHANVQLLADQVEQDIQYNTKTARHMLLHVLFPDFFETIASSEHKENVQREFNALLDLPSSDDIDRDIYTIRARLIEQGRTKSFSFYDEDLRSVWDQKAKKLQTSAPDAEISGPLQEPTSDGNPDFSTLAVSTYLSDTFLKEINELLREKRQLIFEGPPGSGKTFVAEKFARWFTGQPLDADTPLNEQVEIVQFHQSYGYEDFVQGIRPGMNDDKQLVYHVRDGIFLKMCERAASNPDLPFVLIIDEINRGNISRIFGELLLLLEYRHMTARLPHGDGDQGTLRIPENLYIIGTMNTADRSLAQIDYALRRRFYFVRFMPVENGRAPVFERWLATQDMSGEDRIRLADLFVALNHAIRDRLYTDDLQVGHSYFMTPQIATDAGFDRVWTRAVQPLLVEYLHHHRDRDEILASLQPEALMAVPSTETNISPDDQDAP